MTELAERPARIGLPIRWRKEFVLFLPAVGVVTLGVFLLSGSEPDYLGGLRLWQKQALWACLGVAAALGASLVPTRFLFALAPFLYALNLLALLALRFAGTEKGGAVSWFDLGPMRFQPAETMKIVSILALARALNPPKGAVPGFRQFLLATLLAAVPSALIALQPDLGTALVFPGILVAMLYGSRIQRRYLSLIAIPIWAVVALPNEVLPWMVWGSGVGLWLLLLSWKGERAGRLALFGLAHALSVVVVVQGIKPLWTEVLKPHQRDRIAGFVQGVEGDVRELSPAAYHLRQSLIAISSGGLAGQGLGQGLQSSHGFIPMMRTDFIFAVLAEELGFLGSSLLFLLLALLLLASVGAAGGASTWRESSLVFGVVGMWGVHIFVNLGMTMGLMPITGIPLPFFSYGGSSLLANFVALGLVGAVQRAAKAPEEPFKVAF
ncbi:MAG: Peptidoglycan glycosyltransferase MrdB [bacterium]|nr:Peptidoglycan glycosyltransferase MrdB [bacterium]